MAYTVRQLARLAGVSARTLHYYDQIGLLKASGRGDNRYRHYDDEAVLRLQQIRFYRELDFRLSKIRQILDRPDFNTGRALESHRRALQERAARLESLIATVDRTIKHLKGETRMSDQEMFLGFDAETQKRYEEEASRRWGEASVKESSRRWNSYSPQEKARIMAEGGANYRDLVPYIGQDPARPEVQAIIARWHQHLHYFYKPNRQVLQGLGHAYSQDPDFRAFFTKIDPDLPDFLSRAIEVYCKALPGD